jgi:hypothetical protein
MIAGQLQVGGDLLTGTLIKALTNDSCGVRRDAAYALARFGPRKELISGFAVRQDL